MPDNNNTARLDDGLRKSFRPGAVWRDTKGERIQAHGGSIIVVDSVYYWYGENKEHTLVGSDVWHWGVRCYSSADLYNWEDRGLIIPPEPDDPTSPLHPTTGMDRPHIVFNPASGLFVCWLKVMGTGHRQLATILTAENILGPWRRVQEGFKPLGMNAGDFDLVVDPTDGKGYYYFERVHSELICADLNDTYTDVSGYYSTHFPLIRPPMVREAPAHFTRNGMHYLATSGTTWYYPNPTEIAIAPTYHGPFEVLGELHRDDPSATSFRSQISSIFRHPGRNDLYIALADRWLPGLSAEESNRWGEFERIFSGAAGEGPYPVLEADTSIADYVWLPIRFDGDRPYIEWRDEWSLDEFE